MTRSDPNILFLTKYARNGASSRYRTFQYFPWLERAGIQCQAIPLFDEGYLDHLYAAGDRALADVLRAFGHRLLALTSARRCDLIVIEYELVPYFPPVLERLLQALGIDYVVDYDDALFHQYDLHRRAWVRRLLGQKIATVMRGARLVTVGNGYLAEYARRAGARRVEIVPTVIDLTRYPQASTLDASSNDRARHERAPFTIGWIGSPSTAKYLKAIAPALAKVCAQGNASVRLIGSGPIDLGAVPVEVLPWSEETEVELLRQCDVGIMPLPDEPWERGKCGFKLIQYMACGLPAVASPVGVNRDIVEDGVNGFVARTTDDWMQSLEALRTDPKRGRGMGRAGRERVEREYCLQVTAPRFVSLLQSVLGGA